MSREAEDINFFFFFKRTDLTVCMCKSHICICVDTPCTHSAWPCKVLYVSKGHPQNLNVYALEDKERHCTAHASLQRTPMDKPQHTVSPYCQLLKKPLPGPKKPRRRMVLWLNGGAGWFPKLMLAGRGWLKEAPTGWVLTKG